MLEASTLNKEKLSDLTTQAFGQSLYETESCSSTNDLTFELATEGAPHGTVVLAHQQTKGRGRRGSSWFSHPENLQFSLLLRPKVESSARLPQLNIVFGYALLKVLDQLTNLPVMLKWPNDVILHSRKVAGIMSEMRSQTIIVLGCGVNVNCRREDFPAELRASATSLKIESNKHFDQREILRSFLVTSEELYTAFLNKISHT
jgi:BirA family biotin operon repressor/biotin-[acetyl-CoA-carboxylase] ligase